MKTKRRYATLLGLKIGLGTAIAILIANLLNLQHPTSAGTITLLTLLTTKKGTFQLIVNRFITFAITVACSLFFFSFFENKWIAFCVVLIITVIVAVLLDWQATISVNAMVAIHILGELELTLPFMINEFFLLIIGVLCAFVLNLYHSEKFYELDLEKSLQYVETNIRNKLREIVHYIDYQDVNTKIWDDLEEMEKKIEEFLIHAVEFKENCSSDKADYYIEYFEMREFQCEILQMLHYEIRKIRTMPKQAHIISEYIEYLIPYITEDNDPQDQINRLNEILDNLHNEALPTTRDEFENRAILYHILMDLEDFLLRKQQFLNQIKKVH